MPHPSSRHATPPMRVESRAVPGGGYEWAVFFEDDDGCRRQVAAGAMYAPAAEPCAPAGLASMLRSLMGG